LLGERSLELSGLQWKQNPKLKAQLYKNYKIRFSRAQYGSVMTF
jgi:hypothetical protein